jgi:hypothetical protein
LVSQAPGGIAADNLLHWVKKTNVEGSDHQQNEYAEEECISVRFEVFTAVTVKSGVFWDVTQCGL